MNAVERSTVARRVANYIIEHLLIDQPMSADELEEVARNVTEDRHEVIDSADFEEISYLAIKYVSEDSRVVVKETEIEHDWALMHYHRESLPYAQK